MKRFLPRLVAASVFVVLTILLCNLVACSTTGRTSYNTLSAIYTVTDGAVQGYLSAVLHGQSKTNGVPNVMRAWDSFRGAWGAAVTLAASNTNAIAPEFVLSASSNVTFNINQAKAP